jgi:hypothetical protein
MKVTEENLCGVLTLPFQTAMAKDVTTHRRSRQNQPVEADRTPQIVIQHIADIPENTEKRYDKRETEIVRYQCQELSVLYQECL